MKRRVDFEKGWRPCGVRENLIYEARLPHTGNGDSDRELAQLSLSFLTGKARTKVPREKGCRRKFCPVKPARSGGGGVGAKMPAVGPVPRATPPPEVALPLASRPSPPAPSSQACFLQWRMIALTSSRRALCNPSSSGSKSCRLSSRGTHITKCPTSVLYC